MTSLITPCFTDANGCLVCPAVAPIPAVPEVVTSSASPAWNCGANSVAMLDGDIHSVFSVDSMPTGIAIGLKYSRISPVAPPRIDYGFRLYAVGGATVIEVWEGVLQRLSATPYTLGTALEIRRVGGKVIYLIGGQVGYKSSLPSLGPMIVNACLYSAGDEVT